jgi:hypothetical protein
MEMNGEGGVTFRREEEPTGTFWGNEDTKVTVRRSLPLRNS